MIAIAKVTTLIGWGFILYNWLVPFSGNLHTILHWAGLGMAAAHLIEMLVFLPKAQQAEGNTALHALQLFIFGYAHNMALDKANG